MDKKKKPSKGELKRAEIILISRDILVEEGYEAFILRDIAKRAAMKLGNLQYYFPNKVSLLAAVITAEGEHDREILAATMAQHGTAEAQLRCFCQSIISRWSGSSGHIFTTMMFLSHTNAVFKAIYTDIYDHFYAALIPVLERLEPNQPAQSYRLRALLITSLIDGAPIQHAGKDRDDFITEVAAQALRMGVGQR